MSILKGWDGQEKVQQRVGGGLGRALLGRLRDVREFDKLAFWQILVILVFGFGSVVWLIFSNPD